MQSTCMGLISPNTNLNHSNKMWSKMVCLSNRMTVKLNGLAYFGKSSVSLLFCLGLQRRISYNSPLLPLVWVNSWGQGHSNLAGGMWSLGCFTGDHWLSSNIKAIFHPHYYKWNNTLKYGKFLPMPDDWPPTLWDEGRRPLLGAFLPRLIFLGIFPNMM
jgi:hypothetical protein